MFGLFSLPRASYSYYRPAIYRQRYVPVESYLLRSIRQAQEYDNLKTLLYKALMQQQKENETHGIDHRDSCKDESVERKEETANVDQKKKSLPNKFYYFESHSRFDGEKMVEEQKTHRIDSEGKVHQSLKRRLGDQWYETEEIKDEEGKVTVKESWHNVSENEVESFKEEWMSKSENKLKLTHGKREEKQQEEIEMQPDATENKDEIEKEQLKSEEIENKTDLNEIANCENEIEEKSSNQEEPRDSTNSKDNMDQF